MENRFIYEGLKFRLLKFVRRKDSSSLFLCIIPSLYIINVRDATAAVVLKLHSFNEKVISTDFSNHDSLLVTKMS